MQTFNKEERLTHKKSIDLLFSKGKSFNTYPFKIVWMDDNFDSNFPSKLLISVSKKKLKQAVKRNLIKRRIREAYRLNKSIFCNYLISQNKKCTFAIIYVSDGLSLYSDIEQKIILILQRLQSEYEKDFK